MRRDKGASRDRRQLELTPAEIEAQHAEEPQASDRDHRAWIAELLARQRAPLPVPCDDPQCSVCATRTRRYW